MRTKSGNLWGGGLTSRVAVLFSLFSSRAEPSRAEPSRAEPSRAEPSRAEPSRAEPSRSSTRARRRFGVTANTALLPAAVPKPVPAAPRGVPCCLALLLALAAPAAAQTPDIKVFFTTSGAQSPELLREEVEEGEEGPGDPIFGSDGRVQYHTPEGNTMMVEVSLSAGHGEETLVRVGVLPSTATGRGVDYTCLRNCQNVDNVDITIDPWHTYGRGYYTITDDDLREGNETFQLDLFVRSSGSATVSNHASRATARVTIIDDDAPTVSVQGGVSIIEGEAPGWIFHSSFPVGQDMNIGFDTITSGSSTGGMVTLPAGQTRVTYRGAATTDDSTRSDPPDITLNLEQRLITAGGGYKVGDPSTATVEVHDNDDRRAVSTYPTKRLTIAAAYSLAEGNPNADRDVDRIRAFTVRATRDLTNDRTRIRPTVVFEICFTGTATQETGDTWSGNSDYQILKGGIVQTGTCVKDVISGRGPSDNIAIRVRADNRGENDETVIATVSTDHPGVRIGLPGYDAVTYTIFDDDSVEVWQTALQVDVLEGDTAEVELCQSRRRSVVTKIELNIADVGATAGSDYLLGGGRDRIVTIQPGHLCAITTFQTISDGLDEVSEFFNVGLPNSGHSQGVTRAARDDNNRMFLRASVVIQDPLKITMSSNRESKLNPDDTSANALRVGKVSEGQNIRLDFTADRAAPWDIPIRYSLSGSPYDAGYRITPAKGQRQVILKKGQTKASVTMRVANDNIRQDTSKDCCVRIELPPQSRYKPAPAKEIYWVKVIGDLSDSSSQGGGNRDGIGVGNDDDSPQPAVVDTDYTDLILQMYEWRNDPEYVAHKSHTDRWDRALLAFGQPVTDETLTAMTAAEAQAFADRGWMRWVDVAAALWEMEAADSAQEEDAPPVEPDPHAGLIAQMYEWRNDPEYVAYTSHTDRWDRALLAFGEAVTDTSLTPMTAAEAQGFADRGWSRWVDVAAALSALEANDP